MTETAAPLPDDTAFETMIDAAAALQGLSIAPEWRPEVLFHLKTITAAARFVEAFPLEDALESAAIFRA